MLQIQEYNTDQTTFVGRRHASLPLALAPSRTATYFPPCEFCFEDFFF